MALFTEKKEPKHEPPLQLQSFDELLATKMQIEALMGSRIHEEIAAMKQKLLSLAQSAGLTIEDIFSIAQPKKKRQPVAKTYRNPANPEETWKGRGRRPPWLVALIEAGTPIDELLVK